MRYLKRHLPPEALTDIADIADIDFEPPGPAANDERAPAAVHASTARNPDARPEQAARVNSTPLVGFKAPRRLA